jgi:hypothetical protein
MPLHDDLEKMFKTSDASQLDFLKIELEICVVFIQTALEARKDGDDERFARAKSNALKASLSIERFLHHISNEAHKASLAARLSDLDLALDGL